MTIIEDAKPVNVVTSPTRGGMQHSEQLRWDATEEAPLWVTYDPDHYAAIAFVTVPTRRFRYLLRSSGYQHIETRPDGELWARPTSAQDNTSKARLK